MQSAMSPAPLKITSGARGGGGGGGAVSTTAGGLSRGTGSAADGETCGPDGDPHEEKYTTTTARQTAIDITRTMGLFSLITTASDAGGDDAALFTIGG